MGWIHKGSSEYSIFSWEMYVTVLELFIPTIQLVVANETMGALPIWWLIISN